MLRLRAIASLVPFDAGGVADIGYDHGHLLALLAERGQGGLIGVELQADAYARFQARYCREGRRCRCGPAGACCRSPSTTA